MRVVKQALLPLHPQENIIENYLKTGFIVDDLERKNILQHYDKTDLKRLIRKEVRLKYGLFKYGKPTFNPAVCEVISHNAYEISDYAYYIIKA